MRLSFEELARQIYEDEIVFGEDKDLLHDLIIDLYPDEQYDEIMAILKPIPQENLRLRLAVLCTTSIRTDLGQRVGNQALLKEYVRIAQEEPLDVYIEIKRMAKL